MAPTATRHKRESKLMYRPDLDELLSQCELNYLLCYKLWPQLFEGDFESRVKLQAQSRLVRKKVLKLEMQVIDMAKYTSTLNLNISGPARALKSGMSLVVRLYHDARMMEVMEGSGPGALKPVYEKAQKHRSVDEKRQLNRFVGECLKAALNKPLVKQAL